MTTNEYTEMNGYLRLDRGQSLCFLSRQCYGAQFQTDIMTLNTHSQLKATKCWEFCSRSLGKKVEAILTLDQCHSIMYTLSSQELI